jgi:hypothetical protein
LAAAGNLKAEVMLTLCYGCGLRAGGVCRLKAGDIGSELYFFAVFMSKSVALTINRQLKAARALGGWEQIDLAAAAGVAILANASAATEKGAIGRLPYDCARTCAEFLPGARTPHQRSAIRAQTAGSRAPVSGTGPQKRPSKGA